MNNTKRFLLSLVFLCLLPFSVAHATKITIANGDGAGEGFNDATVVAPTASNPGTTLGEQRLFAFQAAANYWERILQSGVEITVNAALDPQTCNATSAILGSAGANTAHRNFTNAPVANTWFFQAEANSIDTTDLSVDPDIGATFNSDIDNNNACLNGTNWDYQIEVTAPAGTISFYETVLHEIGHGLGFATLVGSAGVKFAGADDIYMTFLKDQSAGLGWPAMSDAQRVASSIDTNDLVWTGPLTIAESASGGVTVGLNAGQPQMYAPNPFEGGSSVSHWDTAIERGVINDELMEPSATNDPIFDDLTIAAFYDMHWGDPCRITKTLVANQWMQISLPCVPPTGLNTVAAIIGDDMTGAYDTTWVVWDYVAGAYVNLGTAGIMVPGKGYWLINTSAGATLDMPAKSKKAALTASTQCVGLASNDNDCFNQATVANSATNFQILGSPHRDTFNWNDMRVNIATGASTCNDANGCTMAEAQTANLVNNQGWTYNGAGYTTLLGGPVTPWTGFWVATLAGAAAANPPTVLSPAK